MSDYDVWARKEAALAVRMMILHLRNDHGWGIRRIAKFADVTERRVRDVLHYHNGEGA
jgi:hypothetical protein